MRSAQNSRDVVELDSWFFVASPHVT